MRFAISIPQFVADGEFDPAAFREYLRRAEALGFDSAWTQEQVLGTCAHLGPVETMTYAAACTERIRLGCAVFVSTLHNPVQLAKSLSTVDQLSRGRLDIGVASGGRGRAFPAFGVEQDHFISRFTEGVELMKALWTRSEVHFAGRFWQHNGTSMEPKPFQKPHPPIWFGANSRPGARRTARYADGFFGAGSAPTDRFADQVRALTAELTAADRDPGTFPIAKRVYVAIDDNPDRARERMNTALAELYGHRNPAIESAAVTGTAADCVRGLDEVANAGAELILCTALFDQAEQLDRLADQVIPKLT